MHQGDSGMTVPGLSITNSRIERAGIDASEPNIGVMMEEIDKLLAINTEALGQLHGRISPFLVDPRPVPGETARDSRGSEASSVNQRMQSWINILHSQNSFIDELRGRVDI